MRLTIITAILLVVPHFIHGAPLQKIAPVDNTSSYVQQMQERQQRQADLRESARKPSSQQDPSLVACPPTHEDKLRDLAKLENHSTNCPAPADGAIQQQNPGPLNRGTQDPVEIR